MSILTIIFFIFFFFIVGVSAYFLFRHFKHKRLLALLQLKLFLVSLPAGSREGKELKQEINLSEQLFGALASFQKPFVFEVAVPYVGEEIRFYAAVASPVADAFVRQLHAIWSNSSIEPIDDYNIFNYSGAVVGGVITQKEKFSLPMRTYQEMNTDTFSPMLGGFARVKELGEGAALQFVVRAAKSKIKETILSSLRLLRKGNKLKNVLRGSFSFSFSEFFEAFSPSKKDAKTAPEKVIDDLAIKALEMKSAKPLFEVNARIIASAPAEESAQSLFEGLAAGFAQFGAPYRNEFKVTRQKNTGALTHEFSFREFNAREAMVLNSEELASIFHFPTAFTEMPRVKMVKSKQASPPVQLPKSGTLIGDSIYRGEKQPVFLTDDDRRRHLYIVGQTGTGKTTLMLNMIAEDIANRKGVAVLDPHGELVTGILGLVPKNRFDDVIVFDPGNLERPIGLNMLEYDFNHSEEKTFIVNEMLGIFDKLYDLKTTGGPMFEQYMRNALLLLMEDANPTAGGEPTTLTEIPRLFSDTAFRERKVKRISNPLIVDFWTREAVRVTGETSLANMTTYVGSKFNVFLNNDYVRPIIGQTKSAFNFREIMDTGKILLVNLSKGKIGDTNANLLGMIIVGKLLFAALSRIDMPQEQRKDFYLYIDEFQNFTTDSISVILSEARKYRLNLTVAHQFIAQLTEKIRDAVFGNVGSIVGLRVGPQDAEFLVKQFEPVFDIHDLVNLENARACVKLLINGEPSRPFSLATRRAEIGDAAVQRKLEELSKLKYGRDRHEVEQEIYKRLRQ